MRATSQIFWNRLTFFQDAYPALCYVDLSTVLNYLSTHSDYRHWQTQSSKLVSAQTIINVNLSLIFYVSLSTFSLRSATISSLVKNAHFLANQVALYLSAEWNRTQWSSSFSRPAKNIETERRDKRFVHPLFPRSFVRTFGSWFLVADHLRIALGQRWYTHY